MATIKVRLLDEADWREYRRIRLESLQQSPAAFASTYDDEAALPDSARPHVGDEGAADGAWIDAPMTVEAPVLDRDKGDHPREPGPLRAVAIQPRAREQQQRH